VPLRGESASRRLRPAGAGVGVRESSVTVSCVAGGEADITGQDRLDEPVRLVDYDPAWPAAFAREAARIRAALGNRALVIEHVGSTSVSGLMAKPVIDIVLAVGDASDEPGYVPALEAAGYRLRIREPDWHQHRLFKRLDPAVNLHAFTVGSIEIERMLRFRDWLRVHDEDRERYEATKLALAQRRWRHVQEYADAKTIVVEQIIARATVHAARQRDAS
jgi:GrpB-like predicted nucleotidyltransferase (UPF0157 family)